jgi:MFS family permease
VVSVASSGGSRRSVFAVLGVVFKNPDIGRVEAAYAAFNVAEWGTWLTMLVYAFEKGGVTEAGLVAAFMLVPAAVFAPVLAALGERSSPGRALLTGYVFQAVSCCVVAMAMLLGARILVVYALLVAPSVAFTMTRPSQSAFAPSLARSAEELTATNVISGWIEGLSGLFGPLLAGVVLAVGSPGVVFALGGAISAAGAVLVAPLRDRVPRGLGSSDDGSARSSVAVSLAFVRRNPDARMLVLLLVAQSVALGAFDVLYVELARGVLHRGGDWAGYLNAAFGAGSVVAIVVTARLVGRPRLAVPLVVALGCWTLSLFGLAAAASEVAALVLLVVAGGSRATFDVSARTLLQRVAQPDLLARVFGLLEGLENAALGIGSLLAPALVLIGGARLAFIGLGVLLPLLALGAGRRLLEIDRHATVPIVEISLLRTITMLSLLPAPTLESLARALAPLSVPAGVDVIRQGDEGDLFYAVADGEIDVIHDGTVVKTLHRGDGFGEIALIHLVPRTATLRTRSQTELYTLDRETFLVAVTGHPSSLAAAENTADANLAELRELKKSRSA